jgi:hypothetical protein
MIRRSISPAAFDAIAATLPLGSVGVEPQTDDKGERHIWLEPSVVNKLRAIRGPGERYSDVILRIAGETQRQSAPTSIVGADRARLLAVGERLQEVGQLGVGAMRSDEALDVKAPVPSAPLADDDERRLAHVKVNWLGKEGAIEMFKLFAQAIALVE